MCVTLIIVSYLLKLIVLTFLCNIHVLIKINIKVKKINYFVFIMHQENKHGISRRWSTETDFKDFKSGALRAIINKTRSSVS